MKPIVLSLLLAAVLCCSQICAADLHDEIPADLDDDDSQDELDEDYALLRALEDAHVKTDLRRENTLASQIAADINAEQTMKIPYKIDPCSKIRCGAGRVCRADNDEASCVCVPECPEQNDPRRLVCTNRNQTWNSDCEVYRQRCLCDTDHSHCKGNDYKHIHIDYYGECRDQPDCTTEEMADFPRRMREWLYAVMRDLAQRDELSEHYKSLQLDASSNLTRGWANAAVWKWCDLDGHPHDRSVSRHELFPIRAPLMSLEHCIAPFLESCDPNDDHRITLKEWGGCLELDEDDMMDQCDELSKEASAASSSSSTSQQQQQSQSDED